MLDLSINISNDYTFVIYILWRHPSRRHREFSSSFLNALERVREWGRKLVNDTNRTVTITFKHYLLDEHLYLKHADRFSLEMVVAEQ